MLPDRYLKNELLGRLHRTEGQVVNLRIENDMVKRDLADLSKEKTALQLEISTARIEFNYHQVREHIYARTSTY